MTFSLAVAPAAPRQLVASLGRWSRRSSRRLLEPKRLFLPAIRHLQIEAPSAPRIEARFRDPYLERMPRSPGRHPIIGHYVIRSPKSGSLLT